MSQRTIAYNDALARSEQVRLVGKDLLIQLTIAETSQRGFMLTAQPSYLQNYQDAVAEMTKVLAEFDTLIGQDGRKREHLEKFKALFDQRVSLMAHTIELNQKGRIGEAVSLVRAGRGKALMDEMTQSLNAIDAIEARSLEELTIKSESAAKLTVIGNMAAAGLILILALAAIWMVGQYIREIQDAREVVDNANANLENEVKLRTAELVRANEEIQRFAYIVSHDLRAPLVNVMGYTSELETVGKILDGQILKLETNSPDLIDADAVLAVREDIPEAVGFIRASTDKMDRLINAILRMSREGRRPLKPERLDMTQTIRAIADAVSHQVIENEGRIQVADLPPIVSDRLIVEQVFGNLIDNAVKYAEPGRPLEIKVDAVSVEGDDRITYRVADNGRGISARDHERIFELFRRAGRQDQPGEGLGLAFVRNSIRRLGGTIDLESELGQGSVFYIKLPKYLTPARVQGDAL